jgi:hypothetical protein
MGHGPWQFFPFQRHLDGSRFGNADGNQKHIIAARKNDAWHARFFGLDKTSDGNGQHFHKIPELSKEQVYST